MQNTHISLNIHDKDKALDWVTALSPVLLMACVYYGWEPLLLTLTGAAGYLAATLLLEWAGVSTRSVPAALMSGAVMALCLPAATPIWVTALGGLLAAAVAALPQLYGRFWQDARPLLCPPLVGYLAVRLIFPAYTTTFAMPTQWATDTVAGATPLTTLGEPMNPETLTRMLLGVRPAALGEGCVPVILLAALYLLCRRRLRLIAPATMLATVALLSWMVWGNPLGGLVCGGTLLAALLLADRTFAPEAYGPQAVAGIVAGGLTVLLRATTATDGTAVGVLVACLLSPLYPTLLRWLAVALRWLWAWLRRYVPIAAAWTWRMLKTYVPIAARWVWRVLTVHIPRFCGWIAAVVGRIFGKIKNKG